MDTLVAEILRTTVILPDPITAHAYVCGTYHEIPHLTFVARVRVDSDATWEYALTCNALDAGLVAEAGAGVDDIVYLSTPGAVRDTVEWLDDSSREILEIRHDGLVDLHGATVAAQEAVAVLTTRVLSVARSVATSIAQMQKLVDAQRKAEA